MNVIVIVESCFGNTYQVARAIADRLHDAGSQAELVDAAAAPSLPTADLILVGAPTHNLGLPSAATRAKAVKKGAATPAAGVREWIDRAEPTDARLFTFSTRFDSSWSGSAARAAAKSLRRRGVSAERGEDFVVTGVSGPLAPGELDRARDWAATLAP
ncbi:flavodoxin family protein [Cellulomonas wangsupingiae]|uniref:Flavodoxin domain-containing protein n=1 Tax=Cellulomonas wangsupingiae TaxID=2968085 RepID=A0ABY5K511_9CELL|nr:flavodoxin domain-containing protein [Cellulomonas wangsupingiae]MCC2335040.1 flavodoxin domain-containing protein [Cellulomonas wangsupingiae]UUI65539.1 flavodoxin domain-containing protein [Cellulomonas wangsupingiae]